MKNSIFIIMFYGRAGSPASLTVSPPNIPGRRDFGVGFYTTTIAARVNEALYVSKHSGKQRFLFYEDLFRMCPPFSLRT